MTAHPPSPSPSRAVRPIAAIDIGSTSIRLTIAQVRGDHVEVLEHLHQSVSLGKDTFTLGQIRRPSIEESVQVLKSFRRTLDEYDINHPDQIRAVATTAVREASNRDAFVDRVYMATGIPVEILDEADMTRLTYSSIQPDIRKDKTLSRSNVLVIEVGGGTTEILLITQGNVVLSRTFHLGSLRMREMLDSFRSPVGQQRHLMENSIEGTVDQIRDLVPPRADLEMIILGGDARFAAEHVAHRTASTASRLSRIPTTSLGRLTDTILELSVEELERLHRLPLAEAETLGPALLVYHCLARTLNLPRVLVSDTTMRHGLLMEMSNAGPAIVDFEEKIITSAIETGHKYHFDMDHARQVARISLTLFHGLKDEHRLTPRHRLLLHVAALLHDVGLFISANSHHKHSFYLILNSEIFGLSRRDTTLIATVARYHRKAPPRSSHPEFQGLTREDRLAVSQMSAILRTADALDVAHASRVKDLLVEPAAGQLTLAAPGLDDVTLEEMALMRKGTMFEEVFGMRILLRGERP